jgi:DNA-directed RNA polymerase subunit RPC12/RpoP
MTKYKCPECGTRGANVGTWGVANVYKEHGKLYEINTEIDKHAEWRCTNHCGFEGWSGDFEEKEVKECQSAESAETS